MKAPTRTDTPPTKLADLKPAFPDAKSAAAAGWHTITAPISYLSEGDIAQSILDTLRGTAPGASPVAFCLVGTQWRFQFARRRAELVGLGDEPEPAAEPQAA